MYKFEEKIIDFIQKNIKYFLMAFILLISIIIRFSLRNCLNIDITDCLIPWYEQIKANGGVTSGLSQTIYSARGVECNYTFPYQFVIAILTCFPINPVFGYKIVSCIFDYLNVFAVTYLIYLLNDKKFGYQAIIGYCVMLIHPIIFFNSAMWGQCDAIYTFWILMTLIALINQKYVGAFIFYGLALGFKIQAIFFLPFLLFYYIYKKRFSILYFGISFLTVLVMNIPAFLQGRSLGDALSVYYANTSFFKYMAINYPSFWLIVCEALNEEQYLVLKMIAILIAIGVMAIHMYTWIEKKVSLNKTNIVNMAFLLVYTAVLFMPSMHERYGYVYEILAIVILITNVKTFIPYALMMYFTFKIYGAYLFALETNLYILSIINIAVYISYCYFINKNMISDHDN